MLIRCTLVFVMIMKLTGLVAQGFPVGFRSVTYTDPERNNRSIPCDLYHPASQNGTNVPMAEGVFGHVVFGHGFVMNVNAYEPIAEALAAAGFLVFLPRTEGGFSPVHIEFGRDLAFVAEEAVRRSLEEGDFLSGRLSGQFAIGGHSMGGGCTYLAQQFLGSPAKALFTFAAAETNPSAIAQMPGIETANLMLAGGIDCVTPPQDHQIPMYEAQNTDACKYYIEITGGLHCQFNASNFNCNLGESFCNPGGGISRSEQIALTLELLIPWLQSWLDINCSQWNDFGQIIALEQGFSTEFSCTLPDIGVPDIGLDANLPACPGDFVVLEALNTEGILIWSDGSTGLTLEVSEPGLYFYTLSNGVCAQSSPLVQIDFVEEIFPVVSGAASGSICPNETVILSAEPSLGSIVWNDGQVGPAIEVQMPGVYSFTLEWQSCIFISNAWELTLIEDPLAVVLVEGETVLCPGGNLELSVSVDAEEIFWVNGETGNQIWVELPGIYSYQYTLNGCIFSSQELEVTADDPGNVQILGIPEGPICPGETVTLTADFTTGEVIWNGFSEGPVLEVFEGGWYQFTLQTANCLYESDAVYIEFAEEQEGEVLISGSPILCPGDSILLLASIEGFSVVWSQGSIGSSLYVTSPGLYSFQWIDGSCVFFSDTLDVSFTDNPQLGINSSQGKLCPGSSVVLSSTLDAGQVLWSTGEHSLSIEVTEPGKYFYQSGSDNCLFTSDTFQLFSADTLLFSIVPGSDVLQICPGDSLELFSLPLTESATWSSGETGSVVFASEGGSYSFVVDSLGCTYNSDTLFVSVLEDLMGTIMRERDTICEGSSILLSASLDSIVPTWNTGETAVNIEVGLPGTYYYTYEIFACMFHSDTIMLSLSEEPMSEINIGSFTSLCPDEFIEVEVSGETAGLVWSTGEQTNPLRIDSAGIYAYNLVQGSCIFVSDSFEVFFFPDWFLDSIVGVDTISATTTYVFEVNGNPDWGYEWSAKGLEFLGSNTSRLVEVQLTFDIGEEIWIQVLVDDLVCKDTLLSKNLIKDISTNTVKHIDPIGVSVRYGGDAWCLFADESLAESIVVVYDMKGNRLDQFYWEPPSMLEISYLHYPAGIYGLLWRNKNGQSLFIKVMRK